MEQGKNNEIPHPEPCFLLLFVAAIDHLDYGNHRSCPATAASSPVYFSK